MNTFTPRASRPSRPAITLIVILCLLFAPITALARRGERNFRRGLQHETAQRWDQAVQEYALALAANPADPEYLLHYRRAVFNASQMYMQQGRSLAERGDYPGAYNAFRMAFTYDPNNELAQSEMQRMLRLHREATGTPLTTTPASLQTGQGRPASSTPRPAAGQEETLPPARSETLGDVRYTSVEIDRVIADLARRLDLNVVFDRDLLAQASQRRVTIDLQRVTTAEALDYIFASQNLFFQRLSRRTILVADQSKRPQYQQLVLRTFYLQNADPARVRELILGVIPQTAGRQIVAHPNVQTNSITVRDTPENVRMIGELIESVDKDRAAVVMDVAIYEVSRTDLQQIGLQIGTSGSESTASTLLNIGGSTAVGIGGLANTVAGVPGALGIGLIIPQTTLSALQRNDRTRLIYRNQVHAFDGEETQLRSGQRVPFQSGVVPTYGTTTPSPGGGTAPILSTGGFPIITQEPTGLTLNFTPTVFPNLDVQVKMKIQSREVFNPGTLTPTFTEREITGSARIQNNQTLMLASVAQDRQSNGRVGLPLLGLIPIIGRFLSSPRRDNFTTDIVIAVTPRVLRAPDVTPSDEQQRPVGTQQSPATDTLALLMRQIDREEQLAAAASRNPNATTTAVNTASATNTPAPNTTATVAPANTTTNGNLPVSTITMATAVNNSMSPPPPPPPVNATTTAGPGTAATNTGTAAGSGAAAVITNINLPRVPIESSPSFVPAPRALMDNSATTQQSNRAGTTAENPPPANTAPSVVVPNPFVPVNNASASPPPVTGNTTSQTGATGDNRSAGNNQATSTNSSASPSAVLPPAELRLVPEEQTLRIGERRRLMMVLKTDAPLNLVIASLRFDPRAVAIRSVTTGNMFQSNGEGAMPVITHSTDANGILLVSVAPPANTPIAGAGVFLIIEIEGLATSASQIQFVPENVHLMAADGRTVRVVFAQSRVTVTQ